MKILIAYSTKSGATEKCAHKLAEKIQTLGEIKLANLADCSPDVNEFDLIITGGSVRMGKLQKETVKFIKKNKKKLFAKKTAHYFCCGFPSKADIVINKNYNYEVLNACICVETFGGEMNIEKLVGMDRKIAEMVLNNPQTGGGAKPKILNKNIELFAEKLISELSK